MGGGACTSHKIISMGKGTMQKEIVVDIGERSMRGKLGERDWEIKAIDKHRTWVLIELDSWRFL